MLTIDGVTKNFGGIRALDDVSLYVERGEILGLIGPNGAGKTTLFNVVSGFYKPDKGRVIFEGIEITGWRPHKICELGIARTFQIVKPIETLSVIDNVVVAKLFNTREASYKKRDVIDESYELLRFVNLDGKAHLMPKELTMVEQRRLELARALATEPKLLLLDEVLAGLTPLETEAMLSKIKEVNKKGVTIIMVEHVIRAVMEIADRIAVLHYGRKIAEGTPEKVANDPKVKEAYLGEEY
jgi:branched-chain amino acid transport system ATP-binding protein